MIVGGAIQLDKRAIAEEKEEGVGRWITGLRSASARATFAFPAKKALDTISWEKRRYRGGDDNAFRVKIRSPKPGA